MERNLSEYMESEKSLKHELRNTLVSFTNDCRVDSLGLS